MKRKFFFLLIILLLTTVVFSACNKDDNGGENPSEPTPKIALIAPSEFKYNSAISPTTFSWKKVAHASFYEINFIDTVSGNVVLSKTLAASEAFSLSTTDVIGSDSGSVTDIELAEKLANNENYRFVMFNNSRLIYSVPTSDIVIGSFNVTIKALPDNNSDTYISSAESSTNFIVEEGSLEGTFYPIRTTSDLDKINDFPTYNYKLINDIDFEGAAIAPFGYKTGYFAGKFDGNGKTLKNFKLTSSVTYTKTGFGVFCQLNGAKVYNLNIDSYTSYQPTDFVPSTVNIGVLCGEAVNSIIENVNISNCSINWQNLSYTTSTVTITVGGLVGNLQGNCEIKDCLAKTNINVKCDATDGSYTSKLYFGGLVGYVFTDIKNQDRNMIIERVFASPMSTTGWEICGDTIYSGGLIGSVATNANNYYRLQLIDAYSKGNILLNRSSINASPSSRETRIGLLIGKANVLSMKNTYSTVSYNLSGLIEEGATTPFDENTSSSGFSTAKTTFGYIGYGFNVASCESKGFDGKTIARDYTCNYFAADSIASYNENFFEIGNWTMETPNYREEIKTLSSTALGTSSSYIGFDFNSVWQIVDGLPALR